MSRWDLDASELREPEDNWPLIALVFVAVALIALATGWIEADAMQVCR